MIAFTVRQDAVSVTVLDAASCCLVDLCIFSELAQAPLELLTPPVAVLAGIESGHPAVCPNEPGTLCARSRVPGIGPGHALLRHSHATDVGQNDGDRNDDGDQQ